MPGLVPGIHVLASLEQERRGWPGRSPAMAKSESFSSGKKQPEMLDAFSDSEHLPTGPEYWIIRFRFSRMMTAVAAVDDGCVTLLTAV